MAGSPTGSRPAVPLLLIQHSPAALRRASPDSTRRDLISRFRWYPIRTLLLRSGKGDLPLGMEHVGMQVCDPLPSARCDVEIADRGLDTGIHALPVELRIKVYEVCR